MFSLFGFFSVILIFSSLMVILSRNTVYSVLYLILSFFNAAIIFLMSNAEFLAMTLIIVYVGAVAVLFLFVVMMLNINVVQAKEGMLRYLPFGLVLISILLIELSLIFSDLPVFPESNTKIDISEFLLTRKLDYYSFEKQLEKVTDSKSVESTFTKKVLMLLIDQLDINQNLLDKFDIIFILSINLHINLKEFMYFFLISSS